MASFNAQNSHDPDDPPHTPRLVRKDNGSPPLQPDSEEHVAEQTEGVFRNFAYHMYINESSQTGAETPRMTELISFTNSPLGHTAQVGRQLAMIGDDINARYAPEFGQLIKVLNISSDTAYEAFAGVARKLFHDGNITWGRILTLLCFGYRIAVKVIGDGIFGFFSQIVKFICRFIIKERIAQWIAQQGGWVAALRYVPETVGWSTFSVIVSLAVVSVIGVIFLSRR